MFDFYKTTLGKKFVVAITGSLLFLFVVGHMLGNLKTFMGVDPSSGRHHLDIYGAFLREMFSELMGHGTALWLVRLGLLACLLLHVLTVIKLQAINSRAKPIGYALSANSSSNVASRTMLLGGVILLLFIVYHLLHLTTGNLHFAGFSEGHVYANVFGAFSSTATVIIYLIAMFFLGLHLFHGIWSLCQTLGFDNPDRNPTIRAVAKIGSAVVVLGFVAVPLAVLFGYLPDPAILNLRY